MIQVNQLIKKLTAFFISLTIFAIISIPLVTIIYRKEGILFRN